MTRVPAERIAAIEARKEELQQAMSAPDLAPETFVQLSMDYAEILPVAEAAAEVRRLRDELAGIDAILADPNPDMREMALE
jgi:peptide chain release factor 1